MQKIIQMIFVTGLFLFILASRVEAAAIAGDSATLSLNFKADKRAIQDAADFKKRLAIKAVLDKYNSPMADDVDSFMKACKKYSLDCYFLPAIAGLESTFGQFTYPGSNNPFGWGRGLIMFEDWSEAIDTVGYGLKTNYIDKGATTIDEIGAIYCEGNTWAGKIKWFMKEFEKEEDKLSLYTASFPVQL
jgi:hypothetical protein